jgi:hypothetical protein
MGVHRVSQAETSVKRPSEDEPERTSKKQKSEESEGSKTSDGRTFEEGQGAVNKAANRTNMRFDPSPFENGMVPDPKYDVGKHFYLPKDKIGKCLGRDPDNDGRHRFETSSGELSLRPDQIKGPKSEVGFTYPKGQPGNPFDGKGHVSISVGDATELLAKARKGDDNFGGTTFDKNPESIYPDYGQTSQRLARQGIPILHDVDMRKPETYEPLKDLAPGAEVHMHMPRVPRGTPNYSTQKLIKNYKELPEELNREDLDQSPTVPAPSVYSSEKIHNQIYGTEKDPDWSYHEDVEPDDPRRKEMTDLGYEHKQSTRNESTGAADGTWRTYKSINNKGRDTNPKSE